MSNDCFCWKCQKVTKSKITHENEHGIMFMYVWCKVCNSVKTSKRMEFEEE